jgi:hypothetical protein
MSRFGLRESDTILRGARPFCHRSMKYVVPLVRATLPLVERA